MKTLNLFKFLLLCGCLGCLINQVHSQTILLGPEGFNSDIIIHGSTAPTTVWFAPDYYTPIDYNSTGGCPDGYAGFSGSWNNYWMNFLRTPGVDCSNYDTVYLSFDLSNSHFPSHPNDKVHFNMWIDGAYHNAVFNQTIYFDEQRECVHFDVTYDLTQFIDKTNVLFYLNADCPYNDSKTFMVKFDNIQISAPLLTSNAQNFQIENKIKLINNPVTDKIEFLILKSADGGFQNLSGPTNNNVVISISDIQGREMWKGILLRQPRQIGADLTDQQDKLIEIDIKAFSKGVYFLRVQTNEWTAVKKIVKI